MDFHFFETVGTQKNIFLGIKPCFPDRVVFKLLKIKGSLFLRLKATCAELAEVSGLMSNFRTLVKSCGELEFGFCEFGILEVKLGMQCN